MPSHLTRSVFRRILASEPIVHPGCLRRQARRSMAIASNPVRPSGDREGYKRSTRDQRRTIFNFNIFSRRQEVMEPDIDPGIEKMMELAKRETMRARLPPPETMADAFSKFFGKTAKAITDTQAQLALRTLVYIRSMQKERDQEDQDSGNSRPPLLAATTLKRACKALQNTPAPPSPAHVELARHIYENSQPGFLLNEAMRAYVRLLSMVGESSKAREILTKYMDGFSPNGKRMPAEHLNLEEGEVESPGFDKDAVTGEQTYVNNAYHAWPCVLSGFLQEGNGEEVLRSFAMIPERIRRAPKVTAVMIDYSLGYGDAAAVQQWWTMLRQNNLQAPAVDHSMTGLQTSKVLKWCIERNELQLGQEIVKDLMTTNPPKPVWDAILLWAAGTKKSVDEIDRMMTVMEQANASIRDPLQWRKADNVTINALVEYAIARNDPYMAERFISLGRERNIEPDAKTMVLQMEYRLSVDDVDGALIAYKNLQNMDTSSDNDVLAVNRLIVALCQTNRHDFDTIMNVAADLSDRRVRFKPTTVSALSLLHLSRDESEDVIDLMNTHAFHYSSAERQSIRDAIIAYCLDQKTPTSRAWQGYTVLKEIFDEMPRAERTDLMLSFVDRGRADMVVHIFQNMRRHTRPNTIPTVDTYVAAFMGLAKLREGESLDVVNNLLKLDYTIDVTTYLKNSLMIAYTACGSARAALGFWDEIVASREGPSYNSIHAALRACEKAPWGDVRAQEIWAKLRKRSVDLDQSLWASYIAALAGNGDVSLAISTLESAVERGEVQVDTFLLGSLFNGTSGQEKQAEVEAFARTNFAEMWADLEALGVQTEENGMRSFKIDRKIGP